MDQTSLMRFLWFHWRFINIIGILPKLTKSIFDKLGNQYLDLSLSPLKRAQIITIFHQFIAVETYKLAKKNFYKNYMYMPDKHD